ncbi:MAG: hypothetical protein RLZZ64_128 [Bacteroidota bacterium]|jgi:transcription elongation GreA/GreB family factor
MKTSISTFDLTNCRIQARIESYQTGREVSCSDIIERELSKAKRQEKSLINLVHFTDDESKPVRSNSSNIGKTIIVETEDGNICRYTVVLKSTDINPDNNVVSTRSNIGKALKTVAVDDVIDVNGEVWHIIDIVDNQQTVSA